MAFDTIITRSSALLAAMALLAGCASTNKLVSGPPTADQGKGYLGGIFTGWEDPIGKGPYYAFVFVEERSGEAYTLPFFDPETQGREPHKFKLIEVPVGRYRFSHWYTYRMPFTEKLAESKQFPGVPSVIEVEPARVSYVGSFKTDERYASVTESTYWIKPFPRQAAEVSGLLAAEHPGFALSSK
ncbi:MAG: hypothetical protein QM742_10075 [Aquabacterium sp.]